MDGSRQSAKALMWAIDVAAKYGAAILILRVVTFSMLEIAWKTPNTGGPLIKKNYLNEAEQRDKKTMAGIRKYLNANVRKATSKGVEASFSVMVGDPSESIKAYSRKEKVDLIVMNTRGKGWLRRAILGSVTDDIIRNSEIPVLIIRPGQKQKK